MFKKAVRKQAKLRLALCGPSGSGKTYSAIQIAKGLGGKFAVIDTENHSADLYAHLADYDVAVLNAPYSPARYIEMIKFAEKSGYTTLIIDSLSHAWSGQGGVLQMVDNASKASSSKNSYVAWRTVTPQHDALVEAILQSSLHIIVTMRTKADYQMTTDEKGKSGVRKVGMAPIQREGMDYEFTIVLDLSLDGHIATTSKDRTQLFDGKFMVPTEETGIEILQWLQQGEKADEGAANFPTAPDAVDSEKIIEEDGLVLLQNRLSECSTLSDLMNWKNEARKYSLTSQQKERLNELYKIHKDEIELNQAMSSAQESEVGLAIMN